MKTFKCALYLGCLTLAISLTISRGFSQTTPRLSVQLSNGYAFLSVTGDVGSGCTIQTVTNLSQNWQFVTNLTLSNTQFLLIDTASPGAGQRFYRVYSQQAPTNVVLTNMVWISPGTFTMGSPNTEIGRASWEGPQTRVTISQGFWMGKFDVTQGEYAYVVGNNPSYFTAANGFGTDLSRPVDQVTWNAAAAYCAALTVRERNAGRLPAGYLYRLPTEAEWEYACRAGTKTAFHYGPALWSGMANFYGTDEYDASIGTSYNPSGIYLGRTTSGGSYAPNPWGLYDMHGNVFQWCQDWGDSTTGYSGGSVTDPQGGGLGSGRVVRGGSWGDSARYCRSAARYFYDQGSRSFDYGFRVVLAHPLP